MAKFLIVEDNPSIVALIEATLNLRKHDHDVSFDGKDAYFKIQTNTYDLILLDIMLPEMNGLELLEKIKGLGIPVIVLSAKTTSYDKVLGLDSGAEDYISKPFDPKELLARIDVILRRYQKKSQKLIWHDIELDLNCRTVKQAAKVISLTPKEFDLLQLFIEHLNQALSREEILQKIWGYTFPAETRTIDVHIMQLRQKLDFANHLKAVVKFGYRLNE